MENSFNFIKKYKKYIFYVASTIILFIIGVFLFNNQNTTAETITVSHIDFINQVSVSGKVEMESKADLGFATSGRVGRILVENNQNVKKNQILAQLDIGDLLANLKIKEINSKTSDISLEDARQNLEKVTIQENTKVASAYRTLLTDGLELIPDSSTYDVALPSLGGIYNGPEGRYKIHINKDNITLSDLTLLTFNLEKTKRIINEEGPTPLGTRGLYVSFPNDDLSLYEDTTWFLDIPNKTSSSYLLNFNAYNEARDAQNLAIKNAEFEYQKLLTEENNGVSSVAQAEIDKIRAEIRKSTIYAPFDGIITNVGKEIGEIASSNESVITIMGTGVFLIESYVPEVNIALIKIGDEAKVTLDAYGENILFYAKVISIDPAETIRDGISTYKVQMQFKENDERIKSGMTANVSITIFNKPNVIVIPAGVIFEQDGKKFVQVKTDKGISDREVTLGDVSALGQVEVMSGLEDGETVLLNPLNLSSQK